MNDLKDPDPPKPPWQRPYGWGTKFQHTLRGLAVAILDLGPRNDRPAKSWTLNSFLVHIPAALGVLLMGWYLQLDLMRMVTLTGCIALVFVAETFNCSIEWLAKAITDKNDENIRNALDVAGGSVLLASLFAVAIGAMVFLF